MSKFCGNCGAQLDDAAKICGYCGTPLNEGNKTVSNIPGINYTDPEKKAKTKKRIKLFCSLAVVIVVIVLAINILSGFIGYKGVTRKVINAYKSYNIDALIDMTSPTLLDIYDSFDGSNYIENYYQNYLSNDLDYYEDSAGHNFKISYEINNTYELSERKIDSLFNDLSNYGDEFDNDDISKIMVVEVKITAKDRKSTASKTIDICLSKENGKWNLFGFNSGSLSLR